MSNDDPDRMSKAVRMLENQHLEAREFVLNTLGIARGHEEFERYVVEVMQVLATNNLALAQPRA